MTQPRCILPGLTWMITRRITRRFFLLRPDRDGTMQQIYWYVTAVIAAKYGIRVHAVQVLCTHMHEIVTDTRGKLPLFLRERNRLLANALKRHRGWAEEVFQRKSANCVRLYGADAIARQIAYVLANCIEAALVREPHQWPGVNVLVDDIGTRTVEARRPSMYFDPKNEAWPERATLAITMPELVEKTYGERARDVLRAALETAVAIAREAVRRAGRYVRGRVSDIFSIPFTRQATSKEPTGEREPTFAAARNASYVREAIAEQKAFRALYRHALLALRTGLACFPFPPGSWRWSRELLPTWMANERSRTRASPERAGRAGAPTIAV